MRFASVFSALVLMACNEQGPPANAQSQASRSTSVSPPEVAVPADAPQRNVNDVIGATPGPCGSTRATSFLGQTYRPEMDAELMRVSGATVIRRVRPTGEDAGSGEIVDRRLNVLVNDYGQIIMLDCG